MSEIDASEFQIIDKVCEQLLPEAALVVLELARGMTASGIDESGGVDRARHNLERRLGKAIVIEGSSDFQRLVLECARGNE